MARVTIGGAEYDVPELNFVALERAWPYALEAMTALDPMKAVSAGLRIVAAGIMESENFEMSAFEIDASKLDHKLDIATQVFDLLVARFKKQLKASEIGDVQLAVMEINREAGLVAPEGEAGLLTMEQMLSLSTEIAQPSSPSSSPQDAKEEAGTA